MPLINERDKQFFQPLWRRIVLIAFCFGWAAFEYWRGDPNWAAIAAGMGAIAVWIFIIRFDSGDKGQDKGQDKK